jgi:hypothetical protein
MTPRVPHFGEAVAHHDRKAGACLGEVHSDAVGGDEFVNEVGHGVGSTLVWIIGSGRAPLMDHSRLMMN